MAHTISDEQHEHLCRVAHAQALLARQQDKLVSEVPGLTVLELAEAHLHFAMSLVKEEQKPETGRTLRAYNP